MADLSQGLLQGLNQGIQSYFQADERRQDRDQRRKENRNALVGNLLSQGIEPKAEYFTEDGDYNLDAMRNMGDFGSKAQDRDLKNLQRQKLIKELSQPTLTPAQEAADKNFAKDYADYTAGGGYSGVESQLAELEAAAKDIQDKKLTGGFKGLLPKAVRDIVAPEISIAQDRVEKAIQATLRQTLGAQFTEKEGQRILERTFNPRLSPEENARRALAEAQNIREMARAKQEAGRFYEDRGTLAGYRASNRMGQSPVAQGLLNQQPPHGAPPSPGLVGVQPSAGARSKPKTVIQNGITYTLNPATGQYE